MKRGNTALKRVVSVASVAAMAVAGAVLAAPAASAAGTADAAVAGIRALPIADAAFIKNNALISASADFDGTRTYAADKTGAVPVIGVGNGQAVSSAQIAIPLKAGAAAWTAGQTIEVTLGGGATFASTPSVDITRQAVQLGQLATRAGWAGSNLLGSPRATEADLAVAGAAADNVVGANNELPANRAQRITGAVDSATSTVLTLTLPTADPNQGNAAATAGYLVTISGISVNVKDTVAPGAVTLTSNANVTTVGYVSPYTVTIADDAGYVVQKDGSVELPAITVAETTKTAFDTGAGASTLATFTVSGDKAKVADPAVALAGAGSATLGTSGVGTLTIPAASASATKVESSVITGWSVTNLKAGSDLTLKVAPIGVGVAGGTSTQAATNTNGGIANFSATPAGTNAATLTIKQDTAAPRIAGANRYATAGDIAAKFGTVNAVVLANGLDAKQGVDALSANYLAGAKGAPILLTDSSDNLPQATQNALVKVLKGSAGADNTVTLYVLGATDSVSAAAVTKAEFLAKAAVNSGVTVKTVRLNGTNRYDTSAKVVSEVGAAGIGGYNMGKGTLNTAFLASGTVNADALAAGALSAGASIPVLLTSGTSLEDSVAKAIKDGNIKQIIILGGTDRVSEDLVKALGDDHGVTNVVRVAGDDRYETAADLNTLALKGPAEGGLSQSLGSTAYLANGSGGFADALAVGPLAGLNSDALLTVPVNNLPKSTSDFLSATANKAVIDWIEALGSTDRISDELVAAAQKAIGF